MQKETVLTLANTARATIMADVEQNLVSRVDNLTNQVANKANLTTVQALEVEVANKADKSSVTQDIVFIKEVDFVNGSFTTGTIKVLDGIIVEIL